MDKFEYKVKIGEIKSLIKQGAFEDAVDIADTIDWAGVKNTRDLCLASDLYKKNRLFEESRKILLYAYSKQKSRPIIRSLCELSIELKDLVGAMAYCNEFTQIAPRDPGRYILQYKMYKAQNISIEEQIEVLEKLKETERLKKWEYELATLYHNAGMEQKCIEECEQIILWFVDGSYVMKAYELMALHRPLTEQENYKYEVLRHAGGELNIQYSLKEDEKPADAQKKELEVKGVDVSPYNTQSLQAVVAEGLQDYLEGKAPLPEEKIETYEEAVAADEEALREKVVASQPEVNPELMVTTVYNAVIPEESVGKELEGEDEEDSKPGRSDDDIIGEAANEMANGLLKESVPVMRQDTDEIVPIMPVEEEPAVKEEAEDAVVEQVKEAEETKAGTEAAVEPKTKTTPEPVLEPKKEPMPEPAPEPIQIPKTKYFRPDVSNTGIIETFHKGSHMDEILSQEYDGQISLVVPEEITVEKQITGQISINDVLKDWERKKKANEEKIIAGVKQEAKKRADGLLKDFDEATKSGLLEQIENAMVTAALNEEKERIRASRPKEIKVGDIEGIDEGKKQETKVAAPEPATEKDREIFARNTGEIPEFTPLAQTVPHEELQKEDTEENEDIEEVTEAEAEEKAEDEVTIMDPNSEEEQEGEEENAVEPENETPEEPEPEIKKEVSLEEAEDKKVEEEIKKAISEDEDEKAEKAPAPEKKPHGHGVKPRTLTESEKEQFAAFIHHKSTRRQLAQTLDNVTLSSYTGNVLVTSEEDNEITTFSKLLVREIQMSDANFTGKVAKVSGDNLNRKDIADTLKCVSNGALIISEAEGLKKKTVETLIHELQHTDRGVVVVMQGHADIIDKIVQKNEGMAETFNLRIDLKAFDNKTLVEYAKSFAYDNEYQIDDLGVLALHTRISDMQTSDHEVTLAEIEDIVSDAIYYSNKKTPAHFFDILFGKRYGEEDMIVLREKDFMHY
ncbi:MAG: hypothetical protein K6A38_05490 [Lachnospiraceae bacterium]|nr:hypothetical protein [Lachnospiraceae bacterium]